MRADAADLMSCAKEWREGGGEQLTVTTRTARCGYLVFSFCLAELAPATAAAWAEVRTFLLSLAWPVAGSRPKYLTWI